MCTDNPCFCFPDVVPLHTCSTTENVRSGHTLSARAVVRKPHPTIYILKKGREKNKEMPGGMAF